MAQRHRIGLGVRIPKLPIGCLEARPSEERGSDPMARRHRIGLGGHISKLPIGCLEVRPSGEKDAAHQD